MSPEQAAGQPALGVLPSLIEALRDPACYPHPVRSVRIIETHISFVLLTGTFAYKIKKPVNLGFLDFTTLEDRRLFCFQELALNSRLAPELYLDVVPICGTPQAPRIGADGEAIEYAVRMREFPQEAQADRVLARGELTALQIDALAALIADFHLRAPRAGGSDAYGAPEAILAFVAQNFAQIHALEARTDRLPAVDDIEAWSRREHQLLQETFLRRKHEGAVRECHGDLHLGNIVLLDGQPRAFDCIEFNPELRWIDVMSEVAFLVMDLRAAGRADFAARFLNAYLESTGDYRGLSVLRYYLVYRAMVRAKINLMRGRQLEPGTRESAFAEERLRRYLALAQSCARAPRPFVVITHGFSGSGKTTLSQPLLELTGAIRIRSDVERKRMHGLAPTQPAASGIAEGLYRNEVTRSTYGRLLDLARAIVDSGHGVIVDATFLQRGQRDMFRAFAARAGAPFLIVDFAAGEGTLRSRVIARSTRRDDASDAGLAVLEHQLRTEQPLEDDERESVLVYDACAPADRARDPQAWARVLQRLAPAPG